MLQLVSFVREHGPDARAFVAQAFANSAATMFSLDLVVSSVVFWLFVASSRVRHRWLYVAMSLAVGLSFALPMFLIALAKTEPFGATLPLTGDEGRRHASPARAARPVG